jgi:protein arginine kinase activator
MLCSICGQTEASIHVEGVLDNKSIKLHLCEKCAQEKGMELDIAKPKFSLVDLLANLSDWEIPGHKNLETVRCPSCGLSYSQFREVGRLGCAQCYATFSVQLEPLLKRIHGNSKHLGAKGGAGTKDNVEADANVIRKQLDDAIAAEEFEEAARLRDSLKKIKGRQA